MCPRLKSGAGRHSLTDLDLSAEGAKKILTISDDRWFILQSPGIQFCALQPTDHSAKKIGRCTLVQNGTELSTRKLSNAELGVENICSRDGLNRRNIVWEKIWKGHVRKYVIRKHFVIADALKCLKNTSSVPRQ
jgi:hypothetical protein